MINMLLAISPRHFAGRQFNLESAITKSVLYSMTYAKTPARHRTLPANTNSCLFTITYRKLRTHV